MIDPQMYREMGLTDEEFQIIVKALGREPSYCELGMLAVMWSEHCGYKYSRPVLRRFAEYRKAMEAGGLDFMRHLSEFKVGHYYPPEKPTTENNLDVIKRHREKLDAQGIKVDQPRFLGEDVRAYPFTTRSR